MSSSTSSLRADCPPCAPAQLTDFLENMETLNFEKSLFEMRASLERLHSMQQPLGQLVVEIMALAVGILCTLSWYTLLGPVILYTSFHISFEVQKTVSICAFHRVVVVNGRVWM